jgi:hypothetical protein
MVSQINTFRLSYFVVHRTSEGNHYDPPLSINSPSHCTYNVVHLMVYHSSEQRIDHSPSLQLTFILCDTSDGVS